MSNLKKGFVHTVYFWLTETDNASAREALYAGLQSLAAIPEIQHAYIGVPADTRRPVIDHTYHFAITLIFDNAADQETYQVHPVHQTFVAQCAHLWQRVQIYDAVSYA